MTTQTQGNAIIPVLNAMEIDAMTAHWDFAYTPSHLRELANRLNSPIKIGNSILIQSGCHGSFLGRLDLETINGKIVDFKHELITVNDKIDEDKDIQNIVAGIFEPYEEKLNKIVGETKTLLSRHLALESTMDNFLLKSISHATGNKICFSHGWRCGVPISTGKIILNDLYNIVPMNPKIINVQMKGYEILELLETKLNKTYNINPFGQTGGYVQRAIGIKAYIKIENPNMHRIQKLFIENEELDAQKTYNASYITEQAVPKYLGENREQLNITAIYAMKSYLNYKGEICEEYLNTFVLI